MRIWISNMESRYHSLFAMVFSTHPICLIYICLTVTQEFWPETDPDLLQGQSLLAQLTRPVEMRKALGAHGRAQAASTRMRMRPAKGKNSSNSQQ